MIFFEYLFVRGFEENADYNLNFSLVEECIALGATDFEAHIRDHFDRGLITAEWSSLDHILRDLKNEGKMYAPDLTLINDVIAETQWWACFQAKETNHKNMQAKTIPPQAKMDAPPKFYVPNHPKIGRNDLCLCNSGKKYKKCCLLVATR